MTLQIWYWLVMALWLFFGLWSHWPATPQDRSAWYPVGGSLLQFILFLLLGWQVFGSPIR